MDAAKAQSQLLDVVPVGFLQLLAVRELGHQAVLRREGLVFRDFVVLQALIDVEAFGSPVDRERQESPHLAQHAAVPQLPGSRVLDAEKRFFTEDVPGLYGLVAHGFRIQVLPNIQ
ncbi:MAG: hypothetical protein HYV14_15275 [Elusimicrobia bacterium]|nr:hypothetical protein [Elusimicrobiota bacterium]